MALKLYEIRKKPATRKETTSLPMAGHFYIPLSTIFTITFVFAVPLC